MAAPRTVTSPSSARPSIRALANVVINSGILSIEANTTGLGNPTNTVTINPLGTLQFFQTRYTASTNRSS